MVSLTTYYQNLYIQGQKCKRGPDGSNMLQKRSRFYKDTQPFNPKTDHSDLVRKVLQCFLCNSAEHLANRCPQKEKRSARIQELQARKSNAEKQNGLRPTPLSRPRIIKWEQPTRCRCQYEFPMLGKSMQTLIAVRRVIWSALSLYSNTLFQNY